MAQVWLTFGEIQDLFNCDAADARRRVIADQWERRRGHDGLTRALLPAEVAHDYMSGYRSRNETPCAGANDFAAANDFEVATDFEAASDFEAAMAALRRVFAEDDREAFGAASAASAYPASELAPVKVRVADTGFPIGIRSEVMARHALWAHSWLPHAVNDDRCRPFNRDTHPFLCYPNNASR
jgi:hypothetical protein